MVGYSLHMAITRHVELRPGEQWRDVTEAFMKFCSESKAVTKGGCHEGDPVPTSDGRRYAAIAIPDHSAFLIDYLEDWALRENRQIHP